MVNEEQVYDALRKCLDPELNENVVDLGLIYSVKVDQNKIYLDVTMTSPSCPYAPMLLDDIREKVSSVSAKQKIEVVINLVWDPPWSPEKMSEDLKLRLGMLSDF